MNKRLSLIIGAVLALLAVFLVRVYLNQQSEAIRRLGEQQLEQMRLSQVPILLARRDIAPGTPIDPSMFEIRVAPADQIPPGVATSFDQILAKEAAAPITKGEPILLSSLSATTKTPAATRAATPRVREYSLATATPQGKRAITIPVDNISSIGGMIKPGNYVDVLCLLSVSEEEGKTKKKKEVILPLFQNVLVLAVGTDIAEEAEAAGRYAEEEKTKAKERTTQAKIITLALSPQEANIIAFVQEQGKIRLVLRSPGDETIEPTAPISWETLLMLFMPSSTTKKLQPEETGPPETVEIYRGLEREVVPLSR